MTFTVLIGGVRSGKSDLAAQLAGRSDGPVVFIATAEAGDDEMAARIARHRAARPAHWSTVEAPVELRQAISNAPDDASLVVDCLTIWISNLIAHELSDAEILRLSEEAATSARARRTTIVVVTNEVGAGIVPDNALARRYRDLLGSTNTMWAAAADRTLLVVAGRVLGLQTMEGFDG